MSDQDLIAKFLAERGATVVMATEAQIERLNDAHQAWLRAEAGSDRRAEVQAESRLYDACIGAGMSHDEPDHMAWASARIAAWLTSAPFRSVLGLFHA